jgi:hypothetical protein
MMKYIKNISVGTSKVVIKNAFFFTLVKYSRCMMRKILFMALIYLAYFVNKNIIHCRDNFLQHVDSGFWQQVFQHIISCAAHV